MWYLLKREPLSHPRLRSSALPTVYSICQYSIHSQGVNAGPFTFTISIFIHSNLSIYLSFFFHIYSSLSIHIYLSFLYIHIPPLYQPLLVFSYPSIFVSIYLAVFIYFSQFISTISFIYLFFSYIYIRLFICPVGWGCRIHRLHRCRGVRHPPPTSVLDMTLKQSDGEVPAVLEFKNVEYPFIAIAPRSTLARRGSTW